MRRILIYLLVSPIYLIIIVSSLYSFSRYSNYGNDVSLHVFYFVIFLLSVNFFFKKENIDLFKIILIFSIFLIINKITYVLAILFPLIIFFMLNEKTIFNKASIFMLLFVFLWLAKNFFISGCLVFPIPFLCFENIPWSNYDLVIND